MPHLPLAGASNANAIALEAHGEVSRMRSHRGNMPSLPQTKYCALCPAKFTRTTHLNRHLRSHTNERAHRCNVCSAEFTRSDLLTRHKRTCGDANVNRSRRKSCQACAESKVKCSLEQPCSKCASRGRECIFINDPQASRNRKLEKNSADSALSVSPSESDFAEAESPTNLDSLGPSSPSSTFSFASQGGVGISYPGSPSHLNGHMRPGSSFNLPGVLSASETTSPASSSRSSPRLDFFEPQSQHSDSFSLSLDTLEPDSERRNFFATSLGPVMEDPFAPCLPRPHHQVDLTPHWLETNQSCAGYGNGESTLYSQPTNQDFVSTLANLSMSSSGKGPFSRQLFSKSFPGDQNAPAITLASGTGGPTSEELSHYIYLFFTEFNSQIPLFHRQTWRLEGTHPILVSAMQTCGSLFVKNQTARDFAMKTLTSSRAALITEFSRQGCTQEDQICLLLAIVLLQSIGLLQPRPDQRGLTSMYHENLVMMIQKTRLMRVIGSWTTPDLSSAQNIEHAWKNWARYETFKRALLLAYVQDCSYCVHYSAQPAFAPSEFEINLPCDEGPWKAPNAREWFQLLRRPSPYGTGPPRMLGVNMQLVLSSLRQPTPAMTPYVANPFSAFVLIHSILRDLFSSRSRSTTMTPGASAFSIQCALHNWQRMWTENPEPIHLDQQQKQAIPFVHNALPLYWLARFAEGAKNNNMVPFDTASRSESEGGGLPSNVEDRYRTVKNWLNQINSALRNGSQVFPSLSCRAVPAGTVHFSDDMYPQ